MNEILTPPSGAAPGTASRAVAVERDGELMPLAFHLELQSLQALLSVLATVARLGGRIAFVRAAGTQAVIGLLALPHTAHRVPLLLAQLIEVIAVAAIAWPAGEEFTCDGS
jgi:hypothetical protein